MSFYLYLILIYLISIICIYVTYLQSAKPNWHPGGPDQCNPCSNRQGFWEYKYILTLLSI